jgi:hypothetical protein
VHPLVRLFFSCLSAQQKADNYFSSHQHPQTENDRVNTETHSAFRNNLIIWSPAGHSRLSPKETYGNQPKCCGQHTSSCRQGIHRASLAERRASLARANDARMEQRRNPASSACVWFGNRSELFIGAIQERPVHDL